MMVMTMVIRHYLDCLTCNAPHTLRVSIGHNTYQEHTFPCVNCHEAITVGLIVDFKNIGVSFKYVNNCKIGDNEGAVVNLHPDLAIPNDQLHVDNVFPWLGDTLKIGEIFLQHRPHGKGIFDLHSALWGKRAPFEEWSILQKAWSLTNSGKHELAKEKLAEFVSNSTNSLPTLHEALFHFFTKLMLPKRIELFINAMKIIKAIVIDYPEEFARFREFFIENYSKDHLDKFFELFSDYFRDFSEYSQTLLYVKCNMELPANFRASSVSFQRSKMFYGNAFESLATIIALLACLNNIYKGRRFDQFELMDLRKYLALNKASRSTPFKDTATFAAITESFDSVLRNASHHGAININNKNGILSYRSGGSGALREMPYSRYLFMCNQIMLSAAALLNIELVLIRKT
jgi:hypothetical protein